MRGLVELAAMMGRDIEVCEDYDLPCKDCPARAICERHLDIDAWVAVSKAERGVWWY